VEFNK